MHCVICEKIKKNKVEMQSSDISVDAWTICFSPEARYLASGSHTGKINLFGVESGKQEHQLDTRGKFTLSLAYVSFYPLF